MTLYDCHTHAFLPEDLKVLEGRLTLLDHQLGPGDPNKWQLYDTGDLAGLAREQEAAGVDRWLLLPITGRPERVGELNRYAAAAAARDPRLIPFGILHPAGDLAGDLAELVSLGLAGVKLHPFIQRLSWDDPALLAMLDALADQGLPVLADSMHLEGLLRAKPHLAWAVDKLAPGEFGPASLARAAKARPGLALVAAHGGCLYGWDQVEPLLELGNVYFDLSYLAGLLDAEQAMNLIRRRGVERVLYGSDCPWRKAADNRAWFEELPLSNWEREMIAAGNLAGLLGLG